LLDEALRYAYAANKHPVRGSFAYRFCLNPYAPCDCQCHSISCSLNRELDWFGDVMAGKKRGGNGKAPFASIDFVQYSLTSEDKQNFLAWQTKNTKLLDTLVIELLQTNHKIGLSFNDQTDSFVCSVTGKQEECINASKCFTSHAKDYGTALWVALFKHHVVWDRGVWESLDDAADFG